MSIRAVTNMTHSYNIKGSVEDGYQIGDNDRIFFRARDCSEATLTAMLILMTTQTLMTALTRMVALKLMIVSMLKARLAVTLISGLALAP